MMYTSYVQYSMCRTSTVSLYALDFMKSLLWKQAITITNNCYHGHTLPAPLMHGACEKGSCRGNRRHKADSDVHVALIHVRGERIEEREKKKKKASLQISRDRKKEEDGFEILDSWMKFAIADFYTHAFFACYS